MNIWQRLQGGKAYQWTLYETKKLLGFLWPVVLGGIAAYVTGRIAELQATGQLIEAGLLAAALRWAHLYFADNSKHRA
jgi:hypothetical protein